jgi:hypothetical protein
VCDFEVIGVPSRLRPVHGHVSQVEILKVEKRGQFPNDPVRIKRTQIQYVTFQGPDVLGIEDMKEVTIGGLLF